MTQKRRREDNGKAIGETTALRWEPTHITKPNPRVVPLQFGSLTVCRLKKTLYGLKQSGQRWYQRLCEILKDNLGFTHCEVDHSVFFKISTNNAIIILVHIDDCTVAATNIALVD